MKTNSRHTMPCEFCNEQVEEESTLTCVSSHKEVSYKDACFDNMFYCRDCLNKYGFCKDCAKNISEEEQKDCFDNF